MQFLIQLSSPPVFFKLATRLYRPLLAAGVGIFLAAMAVALGVLPTDAQQGEVYRIIYVHVPAAWMSMFLYTIASGYALMFWVWGTDVSSVMMKSFLPTGAWMTVVALVTGSLWGKPTWGTYWVWDARLTSELLLLFIYLGLIALSSLVEDETKVDRVLAVAIVIGLVNIPLIYFSVIYWNTLHQGMSLGAPGAPRMAPEMRWTLLASVLGLWMICAAIVLARARVKLVERCIDSAWVKEVKL